MSTRMHRLFSGVTACLILSCALPPAAQASPPAGSARRDTALVAALIDDLIERRLREQAIPASELADDAEFIRRVHLDLTGRIPPAQRTLAFLSSKEPDKRRKLIDDLLASGACAEHFATIWRNLIVPREEGAADKPTNRDVFVEWLALQFQKNRGWNDIVVDMLTAEGPVAKIPQGGLIMACADNFQPQPARLADATGKLFWGIQLRCAECHDHPFAQWKQGDFWGIAAFFSRLRHTGFKDRMPSLTEARDPAVKEPQPGAVLAIPATAGKNSGKLIKAKFLHGNEPNLGTEGPYRQRFAAWATAAEHPYFARATVNRWWALLFGCGFVQPLDGFDEANPPSHPELLDKLSAEFTASGFDVKHLCRCICNSLAYQRTSRPLPENESDRRGFSHMAVKALSPEAFYQSVAVVMAADPRTGKGQGLTLEPRSSFVRALRPVGEDAAEGYPQGIPQMLKLLNTPLLNQKAPMVDTLVSRAMSPTAAIESLYVTVLSRRPSSAEVELMSGYLGSQPTPRDGYAGVLWILLNSSEFAFNH